MENQIKAHQTRLDATIEQFKRHQSKAELGGWISYNRAMIANFQHERLVHLWVTLFFGFFLVIILLLAIFLAQPLLYFLTVIILVVEIFYIKHYFFLENSIQKMYLSQVELEKMLLELEKKKNS